MKQEIAVVSVLSGGLGPFSQAMRPAKAIGKPVRNDRVMQLLRNGMTVSAEWASPRGAVLSLFVIFLTGISASAQQYVQAVQEPEAVTILQDVLSQGRPPSDWRSGQVAITGSITTWGKKPVNAPFSLLVRGRTSGFTATLPSGEASFRVDGRSIVRTANGNNEQLPLGTQHRPWMFPLSGIMDLLDRPNLTIALLGKGKSSGMHVALVAVKDATLGPLRSHQEFADRFAIYFEIDTDNHNILAVSDCSVPLDALPSKYCFTHRMEFSDFSTERGIRIPHKITELVGFSPENVFVVGAVTTGN